MHLTCTVIADDSLKTGSRKVIRHSKTSRKTIRWAQYHYVIKVFVIVVNIRISKWNFIDFTCGSVNSTCKMRRYVCGIRIVKLWFLWDMRAFSRKYQKMFTWKPGILTPVSRKNSSLFLSNLHCQIENQYISLLPQASRYWRYNPNLSRVNTHAHISLIHIRTG